MGGFKKFMRETECAGSTTASVASNPSKDRDNARKKRKKGLDNPTDKS